MKREFLDFLPAETRLDVTTERGGEVLEGRLIGPFGEAPIERGVARFVDGDAYAASFGLQWGRFQRVQLDSWNGTRESYQTFHAKTGLVPREFRGLRVLDAGCGMGRFAELFAGAEAEIVAFDLSRGVDVAWDHLGQRSCVHLAQADIFRLPFRLGLFDLVFSLGVLHHTPSAKQAMRRLVQYVKPGGTLAVSVYGRSPRPWSDRLDAAYRAGTRRLPPHLLLRLARLAIPMGSLLLAIQRSSPLGAWLVTAYQSLLPKISLHRDPDWRVLDTFDWHSPRYRSFHTYPEVESWFRGEGFVDVTRLDVPVSVRGRR